MKRVRIVLPSTDRPTLIGDDQTEHSLMEVINQCATIERLIDALRWAQTHLPDYRLLRCHPSTSSYKVIDGGIPDNDIVLVNPNGYFAQFEVSDVSGTKDSNRKENKDLRSLGVPSGHMKDAPRDWLAANR